MSVLPPAAGLARWARRHRAFRRARLRTHELVVFDECASCRARNALGCFLLGLTPTETRVSALGDSNVRIMWNGPKRETIQRPTAPRVAFTTARSSPSQICESSTTPISRQRLQDSALEMN